MASGSNEFTVVIEAPSGPRNRCAWDAGALAPRFVGADLDVPLSGANVGVVPGTPGARGPPVPALVIHDPRLFREARVNARLLAGLVVGTEPTGSFFAATMPVVAGSWTAIQGVDDLPREARAGLAALPQREDGSDARVARVSHDEAIRRIRVARIAGQTVRILPPPARPPRPLEDRFVAPEAALLTDLDLARLPYRFRRCLEQLVLPGERVLGQPTNCSGRRRDSGASSRGSAPEGFSASRIARSVASATSCRSTRRSSRGATSRPSARSNASRG